MAERIIKDYPNISLSPDNIENTLDFDDIFGRTAPIHVEIGSGKGTFLLGHAQHNPDINILGIEWARKYYRLAVDRLGRWQIPNVRIIRTDAATFIAQNFPDNTIECFHLYFPDPWPKKRHNKRRFFSHENLPHLLRCLIDHGTINIATDHADYFEQMTEVINAAVADGNIEIIDFKRADAANPDEFVGTNYERKYIKEKRNINTIAVKKL